MSTNLVIPSEYKAPVAEVSGDVVMPAKTGRRSTRWLVVGVQVLALMTYAMGMAFLVKTTAGTVVLFSVVAPALVAVAVLTLIGVAVHEFRKHHGMTVFEFYDAGQIIFREGELGDCAYFIQSGEVEVIRQENGAESVVAKLSEGEYFGEKALISPAPRNATIRAATQTRVGVIRKRSFFAMIIVMPGKQVDVSRGNRMKRARKYAV